MNNVEQQRVGKRRKGPSKRLDERRRGRVNYWSFVNDFRACVKESHLRFESNYPWFELKARDDFEKFIADFIVSIGGGTANIRGD